MQIATFQVDQERFGMPALLVEEFFRPLPVTRVPGSDPRIDGLVNIRGRTAVVVNMRACLNRPNYAAGDASEMILLETAAGMVTEARELKLFAFEEPLVLRVDSVSQFVYLSNETRHPSPAHVVHQFLDGVIQTEKHYFTLISLQKLIECLLPTGVRA